MNELIFRIPKFINRKEFISRVKQNIPSLSVEPISSFGNEFKANTENLQDLIQLGTLISQMQTFEIGYCIITEKGEIIAPYIIDFTIEGNHIEQYYDYLESIGIDKNEAGCIEKLTISDFSNVQCYKSFKNIASGKKDFTHIVKQLNYYQKTFYGKAVYKNGILSDFGVKRGFAHIYGANESEIAVIYFAIHQNQDKPVTEIQKKELDYWGWYCEKEKGFTHFYHNFMLLNMCFPCGIEIEENEKKNGKAYRLEILTVNGNSI